MYRTLTENLLFTPVAFPLTGPHALTLDQNHSLQHTTEHLKNPVKGGGAHRAHMCTHTHTHAHILTHSRTHAHTHTLKHKVNLIKSVEAS